jgi:hypothetical protein
MRKDQKRPKREEKRRGGREKKGCERPNDIITVVH